MRSADATSYFRHYCEEVTIVAVRIRMKQMGRKHRPYFRIVAIDHRQPRDGRVIEELGTYDPMVTNTDDRVTLGRTAIKYWMSVGALPSEKVAVLIKKYMEEVARQRRTARRSRAAQPAGAARPAPTADDCHALRRADPVSGDLPGLPDAEPAQAGDSERAWSRSTCGTSATGPRASTRASMIGPSAAGPAWCSCPSRCSTRVEAVQATGRRAGPADHADAGGRTADADAGAGTGDAQAAAPAVRPLRGVRRTHPPGAAAARDFDRRLRLQRRRSARHGGDRHGDPLRARRAGRSGEPGGGIAQRSGPAGVSAVHPAARVSRHGSAGGPAERQSSGHRPLAARTIRGPQPANAGCEEPTSRRKEKP